MGFQFRSIRGLRVPHHLRSGSQLILEAQNHRGHHPLLLQSLHRPAAVRDEHKWLWITIQVSPGKPACVWNFSYSQLTDGNPSAGVRI